MPGSTQDTCKARRVQSDHKESQDTADLAKVFSVLRPAESAGFLPPPELLGWQAKYKLPDGRGRLHVEMNPGFRGRDLKFVLSLTLTARGAPTGTSEESLVAWFNTAHEWVVRAFYELTSPDSVRPTGTRAIIHAKPLRRT